MINKKTKNKIVEIGSDYYTELVNTRLSDNLIYEECTSYELLLSGRTCLDYVIREIKEERKIEIAYLPNYCCESMIEPFIRNEIEVLFYDVSFRENLFQYYIDFDKKVDIFLGMEYFGFKNIELDNAFQYYNEKSVCTIEDKTHNAFNKNINRADYEIISLRKWFPIISGGIILRNEENNISLETKKNNEYIIKREDAMDLKRNYIKNNIGLKEDYLIKYTESENILNEDYELYEIDMKSREILKRMNVNKMFERRKSNTRSLLNEIKENEYIYIPNKNSILNKINLFIPIFIDDKYRDHLRKYLISKEIYLPIHWNYTPEGGEREDLLEINRRIISIVCDHRYNSEDMRRIGKHINYFFENIKGG